MLSNETKKTMRTIRGRGNRIIIVIKIRTKTMIISTKRGEDGKSRGLTEMFRYT